MPLRCLRVASVISLKALEPVLSRLYSGKRYRSYRRLADFVIFRFFIFAAV